MPSYLSPGVYVEEVPSAVQAIAGVGTSTAGFIGIVDAAEYVVPRPNPHRNATPVDPPDTVDVRLPRVRSAVADAAVAASLVGATLSDGTKLSDSAAAESAVADARAADQETITIKNTEFLSPIHKIEGGNLAQPKLCTNFGEFRKYFGDFSVDAGQNRLAHAVFGFFHNGGTRCFVGVVTEDTEVDALLEKFGAVDEIAIVAAPGINDATTRDRIVAHCKVATQDRMAIFDSNEAINGSLTLANIDPPPNSDYAAFYFPWIQVFDPATKLQNPDGDGLIYVPPSGHMAGIYARVDTNRGVHKAPANEVVLGAVGLKYQISKAQQDGLNPLGVNCIRELNGNIRVWGARTVGGDANGEWRYVNVRRTFLFLRESIDEGTQWAVFEPNDEKLWAKITRNVSAFLTTVWRSGALFGSTPDQAFYVKCDAETNPPELREVGQVVTEIGVAVVRPAEFVIFRISQWQPQT
ncbi:MAG: phage tail sheath subtilisin-like domain-containing protein [Caldilineaceae bacterium]|nr:phage tail sheath subtilisin-like domain-containing protein [Caldilineaceae bacterium]